MALDAYSLCPGGTGKKIKFCCGADFLPELQKIDRMIEGEQYLGCLKHIDSLMEDGANRDRACLLATQCMLLRFTDQMEAAKTAAIDFQKKHPDNQIALAELAILAAEQNATASLVLLVRALRAANGSLAGRTYQAMGLTAGALLNDGYPLAARALLQLQCDMTSKDSRPQELLSALSQARDIPLLLRDDAVILPCPDDAAWKNQFTEALQAVALGDWQTGADRFAAMAAETPNSQVLWRNLATLRGWLTDNDGCGEALRKYASLRAADADGLDDAVEAEAQAMFLSTDPLGDQIDVLKLVYTVNETDRAQEAFLSSPRFFVVSFDPAQFSDGETPPPKAAYMLLDRPMPGSAEGLTLETMPCLLGQALLFGKQTDREARLEVMGVAADDLPSVQAMIAETAGNAVASSPAQETVGHWSATQKLLRTGWQPPRDATPEQIRTLVEQYRQDAIFQRWPDLKLGVLDGRSPREAASDEASRLRVLATILVLEYWAGPLSETVDFNQLRAQLGLPVQSAIDPQQHPVAELPIARLDRLDPATLSDQDLLIAFYRTGAFALRSAVCKFAKAILERPSLADSNELLLAYSALARNETDVDQSLQYIEKGRQAAGAKKQSCASWDLMELSLRFAAHHGKEAMELIQHIHQKHINEPGVGETLTHMLVDVGLLRPDGTPAFSPAEAQASMGAEPAAADAGGLWTPDGGAEPTGGGSKLWTPD